jgi:acetoacetyl-CoA synthetase
MLATVSIGAIWSSVSVDYGESGILERFSQLEPKILISVDAVIYNGKIHDNISKTESIASKLHSLNNVVMIPFTNNDSKDFSKILNSLGIKLINMQFYPIFWAIFPNKILFLNKFLSTTLL